MSRQWRSLSWRLLSRRLLSRHLPAWRRAEAGSAAVEFAVIAVPLVLLAVGIVDFGRALYFRSGMLHAGDVGARVILLNATAADTAVTGAVREAFKPADGSGLRVDLGTAVVDGTSFRTISLEYDFSFITPFVSAGDITLAHSRRVPIE